MRGTAFAVLVMFCGVIVFVGHLFDTDHLVVAAMAGFLACLLAIALPPSLRGEEMGGRLRRWTWPDNPVSNGLSLLALGAVLVYGVTSLVLVDWSAGEPTTDDVLGFVGLLVVAIVISAPRFSLASLRVITITGLLVALVGAIHLGRHSSIIGSADEVRARATRLRAQLDVAPLADDDTLPSGDHGSGVSTTPPEDPRAVARRAATEALNELDSALSGTPSDPTERLKAVSAQLRALLDTAELGDQAIANAVSAVDELMPKDLAALTTEAVTAVRSALEPPRPPSPRPARARLAIEDLCAKGGGTGVDGRGATATAWICDQDKDKKPELRAAHDARILAELEVARYQLAVARDDAAKTALTASVSEKLEAHVEAVRDGEDGSVDLDILEAARAGVQEAVLATPGLGGGDGAADDAGLPIDLGPLGWTLLLAAAVVGYRRLERVAEAGALGPVTVATEEADDNKQALVDQFTYFVRNSVPSPASVPGDNELDPVAKLLTETSIPGAGRLVEIVTAALAVFRRPRGYQVLVRLADTSIPTTAGGSGEPTRVATKDEMTTTATTVVTRVIDQRSGAQLAQNLSTDTSDREAVRLAAYWAAATVRSRSNEIAAWMRFPATAAKALATFHGRAESSDAPTLEHLQKAVREAPHSGALLLELSNACALMGQHLDAFEMALRAATLHRNYLEARYRFAITCALLTSELSDWRRQPIARKELVLQALDRYPASAARDQVIVKLRQLAATDADLTEALCRFGEHELRATIGLLRLRSVLSRSLRRDERSYWLALLGRDPQGVSQRVQFLKTVKSAKPALVARYAPAAPIEREIGRLLDEPTTCWQVAYNLACAAAIRATDPEQSSQRELALQHLEEAVERPGGEKLKANWVEVDPDLRSLHGLPRFQQFVSRLDRDRSSDAGEA